MPPASWRHAQGAGRRRACADGRCGDSTWTGRSVSQLPCAIKLSRRRQSVTRIRWVVQVQPVVAVMAGAPSCGWGVGWRGWFRSSRWWRSWRGLLPAGGGLVGGGGSGPAGGGGHGGGSFLRVGGWLAGVVQVQPVVAVMAGAPSCGWGVGWRGWFRSSRWWRSWRGLLPAGGGLVGGGGSGPAGGGGHGGGSFLRVGGWLAGVVQVQPVVAVMAGAPSCGWGVGWRGWFRSSRWWRSWRGLLPAGGGLVGGGGSGPAGGRGHRGGSFLRVR